MHENEMQRTDKPRFPISVPVSMGQSYVLSLTAWDAHFPQGPVLKDIIISQAEWHKSCIVYKWHIDCVFLLVIFHVKKHFWLL